MLAAYPQVLRTDRERRGFTEGQVACRLGITVAVYRELEAGERVPDPDTWDRICELFWWPQTLRLGHRVVFRLPLPQDRNLLIYSYAH